jgi:hypothetical protein
MTTTISYLRLYQWPQQPPKGLQPPAGHRKAQGDEAVLLQQQQRKLLGHHATHGRPENSRAEGKAEAA